MQLCSFGSFPHLTRTETFLPMVAAMHDSRKVVTCGAITAFASIRNRPRRGEPKLENARRNRARKRH